MRLVYLETGEEVRLGDVVTVNDTEVSVSYFVPPHKPSSSGKVTVKTEGSAMGREFFVGVIGAKWIEREDQW